MFQLFHNTVLFFPYYFPKKVIIEFEKKFKNIFLQILHYCISRFLFFLFFLQASFCTGSLGYLGLTALQDLQKVQRRVPKVHQGTQTMELELSELTLWTIKETKFARFIGERQQFTYKLDRVHCAKIAR